MRLTPEREAKIRRFSAEWGGVTEDMLIDLFDEIDAMRVELDEVKAQRNALLDEHDATEIGRVRARLTAHDWDVDSSPAVCIDRMAAELARWRHLPDATQQPELPECVTLWRATREVNRHWVGGYGTSIDVPNDCLRWLATASPTAIVAAASSEDVEALALFQVDDPGLMTGEEREAYDRATIVDPATHVVLPRAEVGAWLRATHAVWSELDDGDDFIADMPPALRALRKGGE
jgi:hypothetical protein